MSSFANNKNLSVLKKQLLQITEHEKTPWNLDLDLILCQLEAPERGLVKSSYRWLDLKIAF